MKFYATAEFATSVAAKTRTPVMIIQTEGSCAGSSRYYDIAVAPDIQALLHHEEQAFLTFDSPEEAIAKFDEILAAFPEPGQTPLSLIICLGIPDQATRTFSQIPGSYEGRQVTGMELLQAA